jgi:acyl-CoA thioesterase I
MTLGSDDRVLFTGDSITDCGRDRSRGDDLGNGYAFLVASHLKSRLAMPDLEFLNRGVSGNRVYDLEARLEDDLLSLQPTVLSILIGINDTWRRYDRDIISSTKEFEASYRRILSSVVERFEDIQIVLLEPFLLPVPEDRRQWREDLDPKIGVVRQLAVDFQAEFIALDGMLAEAATRTGAAYWLPDGVHPSPAGHALIADAWLDRVDVER